MKAAILVETNKPLEIHDIELESLKEGEVLIKMVAAGVCHSDHHAMVGHFPTRTPIILGHEGAGIIEEVRERTYYTKPSDLKRLKRKRSKALRAKRNKSNKNNS